ncbi:MAG: aminotransferase class IV [Actinomycetota bacterium]|nr:aminotransferase class IV [Actinomycetota bacterium]
MRAWCNGSLIDPAGPALSVLDHGVTVGDGVFEAVKIVDDEPFAMTRHLRRLVRSARGLGLPEPDLELVRDGVKQTMSDQDLAFGRIRITYTAGISPLGSNRNTTDPTLAVVAAPAPPAQKTTKAATVPWPRNERGAVAGLKTTSYAENVVALAFAADRDASEAIFANTIGNLCEGTGSNVFCVFGGTVVTPPLTAGCLAGVTRELVIEWYDVHERDITMIELLDAEEVFLTSTTRDVQGLTDLDGRGFPKYQPVTERVFKEWAHREALDIDP